MRINQFRKKLRKLIEAGDEFVVWDNTDKGYEDFADSVLIIVGKDDTENFTFEIVKV